MRSGCDVEIGCLALSLRQFHTRSRVRPGSDTVRINQRSANGSVYSFRIWNLTAYGCNSRSGSRCGSQTNPAPAETRDLRMKSPDICNLPVALSRAVVTCGTGDLGSRRIQSRRGFAAAQAPSHCVSLPSPKPESCCAVFRLTLCVHFPRRRGKQLKQVTRKAKSRRNMFCKVRVVFHFFHDGL